MLFLAWLACSEPLCGEVGSATAATGRDGGGNVLVVLVDDVGVEAVERWGVGPVPAATPVLDCLCDRGLRLTQTWASPVCSPTRAEVQTGRYSRRHRLGDILRPGASGYALDVGEDSLADLAAREGYATGLFGKWHLVDSALPDAVTHPNRSGWDRFAGTLHNLGQDAAAQGNGGSYFDGPWIVDGEVGELDRYATTRTVDDALAFVDEVRGQPWLVMLAFHGPHIPYHDPPDELVVERRPGQDPETTQFLAALQAVDRELGRFLRGLDGESLANTAILWVADNGTVQEHLPPEMGTLGGKKTLEESGVRVPAVLAGLPVEERGARGSRTDALAHVVDLYPTVQALIGGTTPAELDGSSWLPLLDDPDAVVHEGVASSFFEDPGGPPRALRRAVRGPDHKLYVDVEGVEHLHRVGPASIDDGPDLLAGGLSAEEEEALRSLRAELERLEASYGE